MISCLMIDSYPYAIKNSMFINYLAMHSLFIKVILFFEWFSVVVGDIVISNEVPKRSVGRSEKTWPHLALWITHEGHFINWYEFLTR